MTAHPDITYENPLWETDAEAAFAEAAHRIALTAEAGADTIYFSDLLALKRIPPGMDHMPTLREVHLGLAALPDGRIAGGVMNINNFADLTTLTQITTLNLSHTRITDIKPLAAMTGLTTLDLPSTGITDIEPLAAMKGMTTLNLSSTGITDIEPLAAMKGMTTLNLLHTGITDIEPLAAMTGMTTLNLSHTGITEFEPLAAMKGLTTLTLRNTRITDIKPLAAMTGLTTLDLSHTGITEFEPLAAMKGMTTLNLSNTRITDIKPLAAMTGLTTLDLSNTRITDIKPLAAMTGLTTLDLSSTGITDIKPLAAMTGLTTLDLSNTRITDIKPLAAMTGLTTLDLSSTGITDLSGLLQIPAFEEERAEGLRYASTPVAASDNRFGMLSRLDQRECAVQTVQYLKGTHPDFREPPGGPVRTPAALREALARAAPVEIVEIGGKAAAVPNSALGPVERLAPAELRQRLSAQATFADHAITLLKDSNVRAEMTLILDAYRKALDPGEGVDPNWFTIDGFMVPLRSSIGDADNRAAVTQATNAHLDHLVAQHDALRPMMKPPDEAMPVAPEPDIDKVSIDEIIRNLDEAAAIAHGEDGHTVLHQSMVNFFDAMTAMAKTARANPLSPDPPETTERKRGLLRRVISGAGGTLAALVATLARLTGIHTWATSSAGQAVISKFGPILERLLALF